MVRKNNYFFSSKDAKTMMLQAVCKRIMANPMRADTKKKAWDSPFMPRVPGPAQSARTLTKARAADIVP